MAMQSILLKTKRQILLFQGLIHAASEPYQGSLKLVTAGHRWLNACPVFLPESVNYRWERNELNPTLGWGSPQMRDNFYRQAPKFASLIYSACYFP